VNLSFFKISAFLLFPVFAGAQLKIENMKTGAGQVTFDYEIKKPLVAPLSQKPNLAGALSDKNGELFYPVRLSLPYGASITRISVSENNFPVKCVSGEPGLLRSVFIAPINLYPLSKARGGWRLSTRGHVSISYSLNSSVAPRTTPHLDSPVAERLLSSLLANYDASVQHRVAPLAGLRKTRSTLANGTRLKFFVKQDGVYQIRFEDLQAFGIPANAIDPVTFQLFTASREIPLSVDLAVPGKFAPGDRLLFFGEFLRGKGTDFYPEHTVSRAYYLDWGKRNGVRAPRVSAAPKVLNPDGTIKLIDPFAFTGSDDLTIRVESFRRNIHLEEEIQIMRLADDPGRVSSIGVTVEDLEFAPIDYWLWARFTQGTHPLEFFLDADPAEEGTAQFRIGFQGEGLGEHRVKIFINGSPILMAGDLEELVWAGQVQAVFVSQTLQKNLELLHGGKDTLVVELSNATGGDAVRLNWIEVDYDARPGVVNKGKQVISLDAGVVKKKGVYSLSISGLIGTPEIWDVAGRRFSNFSSFDDRILLTDVISGPTSYFVGRGNSPARNLCKISRDKVPFRRFFIGPLRGVPN